MSKIKFYKIFCFINISIIIAISFYNNEFHYHKSDSYKFFHNSSNWFDYIGNFFSFNSGIMMFFANIIKKITFDNYLIFNIFSIILFVFFPLLRIGRKYNYKFNPYLLILFTFLPSWHYWYSAYSKEILCFALITIYFCNINRYEKYLSFFFLFLVRPVYTLGIVLAEIFYDFFKSKKLSLRLIIFIILFIPINTFLHNKIQSHDLTINTLGTHWQDGQVLPNHSVENFSAVYYFLLRPFFTEIENITIAILSIEATITTLIFLSLILMNLKRKFFDKLSLSIIFIILLLSFSNPNFGTLVRKKQNVITMMLIFFNINNKKTYNIKLYNQNPLKY